MWSRNGSSRHLLLNLETIPSPAGYQHLGVRDSQGGNALSPRVCFSILKEVVIGFEAIVEGCVERARGTQGQDGVGGAELYCTLSRAERGPHFMAGGAERERGRWWEDHLSVCSFDPPCLLL